MKEAQKQQSFTLVCVGAVLYFRDFLGVTPHPTLSLGVKTNFIKRSQAQRPTIKRIINQRLSCHGMHGTVGGVFGNASQKMTHAFFQICRVQFPRAASSLIRKFTSVEETVRGWLLTVSTQKLRQTRKCCSADVPELVQRKTKKNPQTTRRQMNVINKKIYQKKKYTHTFALSR